MLPSGDCGDYPENMPTDWKSFLIGLAVWGGFILVLFSPPGVEFVKSQIEKNKQEKAIKQAKQEKNAETAYVLGAQPEKMVGCLTSARSR